MFSGELRADLFKHVAALNITQLRVKSCTTTCRAAGPIHSGSIEGDLGESGFIIKGRVYDHSPEAGESQRPRAEKLE